MDSSFFAMPDATTSTAAPGAEAGPSPSVADGIFHRLDPRSVRVERIVGWIAAGVVAVFSLVTLLGVVLHARPPSSVQGLLIAAWLVLVALLGWRAQWWPEIAYRHIAYRVDGLGIEIRRGVVWRTIVSVPRSRVQHTDVSQGPIDRSHGLGTLIIYSAGTNHARVSLGGVAYERALELRDFLVAAEGADAV
jgi:membrane protein YdbS with pleckstrin-like domain